MSLCCFVNIGIVVKLLKQVCRNANPLLKICRIDFVKILRKINELLIGNFVLSYLNHVLMR